MHTVRKQILEILKSHHRASVAELADLLAMPAVSVRHHLDILQGDNLIRVERAERNGGVGRPQQIYSLTEEAMAHFPNNFAALAGSLARQIKQVLPAEQVACAFQNLALEMAQEFPEPCVDESFETRLQRVSDFLNKRGYLAEWEQDAETQRYRLVKHNCPYSGVSGEHPELCSMDQVLIDHLLGCHCERTQWMRNGASACIYQISEELSSIGNNDSQAVTHSNIALIL